MIYKSVHDIVLDDVFLELPSLSPNADVQVLLKLEGLNPAGSIKIKTAVGLITDLEDKGILGPSGRVIESSSGNLGVALATVCAAKGYQLTIVTDPLASQHLVRRIRALGARIEQVTERDENGGYLQTRIDYIHKRLANDPELVWTNQYANDANWRAHAATTARSIWRHLGHVDALVVGAGTTGTLMGCAAYFQAHSPGTQIVGVDVEGSVTFGHPPKERFIPGLGASRRPEIFRDIPAIKKVLVPERDSIMMCRRIAAEYGLLAGGSTGTVLVAAEQVAASLPPGSRLIAISPDLGDSYLDTVYSASWTAAHFPRVPEGAEPRGILR
ncbi:MAG TPA: 2,3-diaminopropionate biosynthesis protein SbnA [Streptosporangiaceae bacterium]|jgi:cysteine synthase A|nr:2,3-diaminopropionate biosynthesis protein SbnA [Streptosporangiaceae bacterium]